MQTKRRKGTAAVFNGKLMGATGAERGAGLGLQKEKYKPRVAVGFIL